MAAPRNKTNWSLAPGGWGIGTPNDMRDEEFSRRQGNARRRRKQTVDDLTVDDIVYSAEAADRAAQNFAFQDSMAFSQRVQEEKNNLELAKQKDLFEVAKIAGLSSRLRPKTNSKNDSSYGKFDLDDEDDSLDVKVY